MKISLNSKLDSIYAMEDRSNMNPVIEASEEKTVTRKNIIAAILKKLDDKRKYCYRGTAMQTM